MYLIIRLKDSAPHFAELKELYPDNGSEDGRIHFYLVDGLRFMVIEIGSGMYFDHFDDNTTHIYTWTVDREETWVNIDYIDYFYTDKENPFHDKYER